MSDERLRELERRWRESGELDDEVAWLAERVRAGELSPRALELAAHLGHEAAGRLSPASEVLIQAGQLAYGKLLGPPTELHQLGAELETFGQEAALRGATGAVRVVFAARTPSPDPAACVGAALERCEAWLASPGEAARRQAEEALPELAELAPRPSPEPEEMGDYFLGAAALLAVQLASIPVPAWGPSRRLGEALTGAALALAPEAHLLLPLPLKTLELPQEAVDAVRAAVYDALVPWALSGRARLAPAAPPPIWRRLWRRLTGG